MFVKRSDFRVFRLISLLWVRKIPKFIHETVTTASVLTDLPLSLYIYIYIYTSKNREDNQQTQPTHDAECGNRTRATLVRGECSHHHATTSLSILFYFTWGHHPIFLLQPFISVRAVSVF